MRLLLVDDDVESRVLYAESLREAGLTVTEADDGLSALDAIEKEIPDLVFTGIDMPRMDGYALVAALKAHPETMHIPVVFLSHHGRPEDEKRAQEIGVKDFIVRGTTTPREVAIRLKAQLHASEYVIALDSKLYDAGKLAQDLNINQEFSCDAPGHERYVLKLRLKDADTKTFEATLTCL